MPKRVLVPSLKVKRLIRLFDSSPSKMTKKKSSAPAAATAVKSATALAHMAEELEKDEVAASRSAATAAPVDPVANTSSLDAMATAVSDFFIPVARKRSSDLKARGQGTRRHSEGEEAMAAGIGLAAGGSQTPKGSAPAIPEAAGTPKGGTAMMAKSSIMRSFLNTGEKSTTKRTREEWSASPQLANKAKKTAEVYRPPAQRPSQQRPEQQQQEQEQGDQQGQEYQAWQIELYNKMKAMGGDAIPAELYKGFLDLFTATHEERVMVQAHSIAKEVFHRESELKKCRRSLLIHNVDKWVENDKETEGYSLADRATAAVHKLTGGMVTVQEAFPLGQWKMGQAPTSVYMTFGSARQKTCFFRVLANKMRVAADQANGGPTPLGGISCRDAFPKDKVNDAKALVDKGMGLKRSGKIAAFRVVARGPGCLPVLEARHRGRDGLSYGWEVWKDDERMDDGHEGQARGRDGARRPPASGPRRMMEVGLGAQPRVPMPRRSDKELLSAPMTREFIRGLNTEELIVVHDQGLCGLKPRASLQAATETVRVYDTEAENEAAEWRYGEGHMDGEYFDD
jgi:HD-GYP domain-containing protein (c-di-GMP phosphodiesterase class II)